MIEIIIAVGQYHLTSFFLNAASARCRKTLSRLPLSLADHELLRPEFWR